ncbi:hypothetical protein [Antarctobacter jejuensis]|uniref:hypothetical protein n=1 Tax=Antarctobacter jejuensis TaxID=1439938 RepID=UPI003FD3B7AB
MRRVVYWVFLIAGLALLALGVLATGALLFLFFIGGGAGYVAHYGAWEFANLLLPLVPGPVLLAVAWILK